MKAIDIRTKAKEIRNKKNEMGFDELKAFYDEAFDYVAANMDGWTEKFNAQINTAMDEIFKAICQMTPVDEKVVDEVEKLIENMDVVEADDAEVVTEEAVEKAVEEDVEDEAPKKDQVETENGEKIKGIKKNFKTVLEMMADKTDPVLEAVRWNAVVYAGETYNTVKCIKGMLTRRGYAVMGDNDAMEVRKDDMLVAEITAYNGIITDFAIV